MGARLMGTDRPLSQAPHMMHRNEFRLTLTTHYATIGLTPTYWDFHFEWLHYLHNPSAYTWPGPDGPTQAQAAQ